MTATARADVVAAVVLQRRGRLTLIIVHDVAEMVSAAVMRLPHAHRIVREVDIAVITED